MSACNHCTMKRLQQSAKEKGKRVVRIPSIKMGSLGGMEIYMLRKGEKPSKANWVAWMMEVTDSCVC